MRFAPKAAAFFGFLLPGFAVGWMLSCGMLRMGGDPAEAGALFAAAALAGAVVGRRTSRFSEWAWFGLLILPNLPVITPKILFPAVSFAFGAFAVRPIRTLHRHLFQTGALLAVAAGFLVGAGPLTHDLPLRFALALLVPAGAMLAADGIKKRKTVFTLYLLTGCLLLSNNWPQNDRPYCASWGAAVSVFKNPDAQETRTRTGDRLYLYPGDFQRRSPDVLTAALQPQAEQLRALVVEEGWSAAKEKFAALHWIADVQRLHYSPLTSYGHDDPAHFRQMMRQDPDARFELIFVQEFPSASHAAQAMFFRMLLRRLAPGGVLTAPAEFDAPVRGYHQAFLPGSRESLRIWAAEGVPLADTFPKLEAALKRRSAGHAEILPGGMLETLYGLRLPERDTALPSPNTPFRRVRAKLTDILPGPLALLPAAVIWGLLFWFKRYPRRGENLAIFAKGTACMLGLLAIMAEAEAFQLLIAGPVAAFFGLAALGLPHRTEHPARAALAAVCAAAVTAAILHISPADIPLLEWAEFFPVAAVPTTLLFGIALWCGPGHKGAESARYLHFAGMFFGAVLYTRLPAWAALPTALAFFPA